AEEVESLGTHGEIGAIAERDERALSRSGRRHPGAAEAARPDVDGALDLVPGLLQREVRLGLGHAREVVAGEAVVPAVTADLVTRVTELGERESKYSRGVRRREDRERHLEPLEIEMQALEHRALGARLVVRSELQVQGHDELQGLTHASTPRRGPPPRSP